MIDRSTPPVGLLVSVDELKNHLRVVTDGDDAYLQSIIRSATSHAEAMTGRILLSSTFTWKPEVELVGEIEVPIAPVTSVTAFDVSGAEPVEISADLYKFQPSALYTGGSPLRGKVTLLTGFPTENVQFSVVAGYPFEEKEVPYTPAENILLSDGRCGVSRDTVTLVFDRPVSAKSCIPSDFVLRTSSSDSVPAFEVSTAENGTVVVRFLADLPTGISLDLDFGEAPITDVGGNVLGSTDFVFTYTEPVEAQAPPPLPTRVEYVSSAPDVVKQWILVRCGTLYQQRTEIATRAGKSNDALFPRNFIDSLLDTLRML